MQEGWGARKIVFDMFRYKFWISNAFSNRGHREVEPPWKNFLSHLGINLEFLMLFLKGGAGGRSPPLKFLSHFCINLKFLMVFIRGEGQGSGAPHKIFWVLKILSSNTFTFYSRVPQIEGTLHLLPPRAHPTVMLSRQLVKDSPLPLDRGILNFPGQPSPRRLLKTRIVATNTL